MPVHPGIAGHRPAADACRRVGASILFWLILAVLVATGWLTPGARAQDGSGRPSESIRSAAGKGSGQQNAAADRGAVTGESESEGRKISPTELMVDRTPPTEKTSESVLKAIRDVLSQNRNRERRGRLSVLRGGLKIVPQLRYWIRRVRFQAGRVESLVREILQRHGSDLDGNSGFSRDVSVSEFFHRKLLEARRLAQQGNYRQAKRIAESLLELDKESPIAWELRRVVRESRERVVAEELEPRIDGGSLYYEVGEDLDIMFHLINRSRVPVSILLEKGVLGKLEIELMQRFLDGSASKNVEGVILRSRPRMRELVLEPGDVWMQKVSLKALKLKRLLHISGAVARVRIVGKFRPTRWLFEGKKDENIPISIAPTEFWIVPPGQKKGLESPHKKLVAALFFGQTESFLVGGQLSVWAGKTDPILNEKLVEVLVDHLDELDEVRGKLAQIFLREATGKGYKEVEKWQKWWARYRDAKVEERQGEESEAAAAEGEAGEGEAAEGEG